MPRPENPCPTRRWLGARLCFGTGCSRRRRWCLRILFLPPIALAAALLVATQTRVAAWIVLPRVRAATGLEVRADRVRIRPDGTIVIHGAVFGLPGEGGEAFLRARRLDARASWRAGRATEVVIVGGVLDVVRRPDGSLNLGSLDAPEPARPRGRSRAAGPGPGASPPVLPRLFVRASSVRLIERTPEGPRLLRELAVDGALRPDPAAPDRYRLALREGSGPAPMFIKGTFDERGLDVALDGADLRTITPDSVPSDVRETYRALALAGTIGRTTFTYSDRAGIGVRMTLEGVDLNLPIPREPGGEGGGDAPDEPMRLRGVRGSIDFVRAGMRAELDGSLEDLPMRVRLAYDGYGPEGAFDCELSSDNFLVARNPRLLPYAPPLVRYRLGTFSNPTAEMDARVRVWRDAPGAPGEASPIRFSGSMHFRHGEAAFDRFPYPFTNMTGVVRFDNDTVEVVRITGENATGARLFATASFTPPDADPETAVDVYVTGAPLDGVMREALGPAREGILDSLCDAREHERLVRAGLVQGSSEAAATRARLLAARARLALGVATGVDRARLDAIRAEIGSLEHALRVPVFDLGGAVDVAVRVRKARGDGTPWLTRVDLDFARLGIVASSFPLPIEGRDVRVVLDDETGRIVAGRFEGAAGGEAEITGSLRIARPVSGPELDIHAANVPLGAHLRHAIARLGAEAGEGEPGPIETARVLHALGASARLSGEISVRDDHGRTGVLGDVAIADWRLDARAPGATPGERPGALIFAGDVGSLRINSTSEAIIDLSLVGGARLASESGETHAGATTLDLELFDDGPRAVITANVADVRSPFEPYIGVFSSEAAGSLSSWRAEHEPSGLVDARVAIDSTSGGGGDTRVEVELSNASALALDTPAGRVEVSSVRGSLAVESDATGLGFRSRELAGSIREAGGRTLAAFEASGGIGPGHDALDLTLDGVDLGASATRRCGVLAGLGEGALALADPRGVADARLRVGDGLTGVLSFREGEIMHAGQAIRLRSPGARVEIKPGGEVALSGFEVEGSGWTASIQADLRHEPGGAGRRATGEAAIDASSMGEGLRGVLPEALTAALDEVGFKVDGPISSRALRFDLPVGGAASGGTASVDGEVVLSDASLDVGVELRGVSGRVGVRYERAPEEGDGRASRSLIDLDVEAEAGRAEGVEITRTTARVRAGSRSGPEGGADRLDLEAEFWGDCHQGRFAGDAVVARQGAGPVAFDASVRSAGVLLSGVLADLRAGEVGDRGLIDAEIALSGIAGDASSRRGRGSIRVGGGEVLRLPLVLPIIEFGNLQLPIADRLDYAEGAFLIDGSTIVVEEMSLFSRTIALFGYGTISWPERRLDLDVRSKAARPIPILSPLIEGLRDNLMATHVSGTMDEPSFTLRRARGETRRAGVEGGVIRIGAREASSPLLEIERRARARRGLARPGVAEANEP